VIYKWIIAGCVFLGIGSFLMMFWLLWGVVIYKNVMVSGPGPFSNVFLASPQSLMSYIDYLGDSSLLEHDKYYWIRYRSGRLPKLRKLSFWNKPEAVGLAPMVGCSLPRDYFGGKLNVRDFFFDKSFEKSTDSTQLINKFGLRCLSHSGDITILGTLYDRIEQFGNIFEIK
jgi:hypothetical protein